MSTPITVEEQTYKIWKIGTIISGVVCVMLFITFWNMSDPFWTGIIRLCSFIFFALLVLGYLKMMNGPLKITLEESDKLLLVSYKKNGNVIQEEQFEQKTIRKIIPAPPKQNSIHYLLQPRSAAFKIDFNDSDRQLYLFEFSGRPLFFGESSQKEIEHFLRGLGISQQT